MMWPVVYIFYYYDFVILCKFLPIAPMQYVDHTLGMEGKGSWKLDPRSLSCTDVYTK